MTAPAHPWHGRPRPPRGPRGADHDDLAADALVAWLEHVDRGSRSMPVGPDWRERLYAFDGDLDPWTVRV